MFCSPFKLEEVSKTPMNPQVIFGSITVGIILIAGVVLMSQFKTQPAVAENQPIKIASSSVPKELNMVESTTGLKYEDEVVGSGDIAEPGQKVTVHYTGWLYPTGEMFDSSKNHGSPFSFPLGAGRVIAGWDQGVKGMKVGGKRILIIPPDLGYGAYGAPPSIPPDATLKFEVELLAVQ